MSTKTNTTAAPAAKATKVVTRPEAKRTAKPAAATKDVAAATKVKPSNRSAAKVQAEDAAAELAARKGAKPETPRAIAARERLAAKQAEDAAATEAPTEQVGPTSADIAAMGRLDRLQAAKVEAAALREWKNGDRTTEMPATPVLDWMSDPTNDVTKTTRTAARKTVANDPERDALIEKVIREGRERGDGWWTIAGTFNGLGVPTARGGEWMGPTVWNHAKRLGLHGTVTKGEKPAKAETAKPAAKGKAKPAA
jgi:hypothetical protein